MQLSTAGVIENHLRAARIGVRAVMQDYADDSVLVTPNATYQSRDEIHQFFANFFNSLPARFFDAFRLNRQEVVGDAGCILWESKPWLLLATDTFLVRNGKIQFQSFAAYAAGDDEHRPS
jgi:hypothetical protein